MKTFFLAGVTIGIIGVVVTEILLCYAMIRKEKSKISTRRCGEITIFFFGILVISATALMVLYK